MALLKSVNGYPNHEGEHSKDYECIQCGNDRFCCWSCCPSYDPSCICHYPVKEWNNAHEDWFCSACGGTLEES